MRRPVLLALELAALAATVLFAVKLGSHRADQAAFIGQVALWLWLSLLAVRRAWRPRRPAPSRERGACAGWRATSPPSADHAA